MTNKRKKSRRGKSHKKARKVHSFYKIIALLLAGVLGLSGYDYYQTGTFTHTIETAERIAGSIGKLPERAAELGEQAESLPEQVADLGKQAGNFLKQITGGSEGANNIRSLKEIPEYAGESYVTVHNNIPSFTDEQKKAAPYEFYSELDGLGRCGYAEAKISKELMPAEERGPIGMIKPSGWHTVKYDIIDGKYLYNRCHLIGYQLTGENANEKNLITGTRYLNVTGMLPWENMVADYIQETGDRVLYRVTPIYDGDNLVASGVQMEAESINLDEICFNIFVFNVQPGIGIDYANGNSWME